MRIFVTGAGGFLGTAVVSAAQSCGHEVRALIRDPRRWNGPSDDSVELVAGDLRHPDRWVDALDGVDAVIHLAATKGGDLHSQFSGTVVGTERLLDAMERRPPRRLVHVSTFSVYDYEALRDGAPLDESSPLEHDPSRRDEYAQTKLVQERLVRDRSAGAAWDLVVVRPGAVWGPGELWDGGGLMGLGPALTLVVAPRAPLKLTYVDNCADALVAAATVPGAAAHTIDIVDDDPPDARTFSAALRKAGLPVRRPVAVPYSVMHGFARALEAVNRSTLDGRAKLPGVFEPAKLAARAKPLKYPNRVAHDVLGWSPAVSVSEGIRRCVEANRVRS